MLKRRQLWWAESPKPIKSEPGYKGPVLVTQADAFNVSKISTVIVVAITSNTKLVDTPGNVYLAKAKSGLSKDSVVNVSQIMTLEKRFLVEPIGTLDRVTSGQIDEGLQLVLNLKFSIYTSLLNNDETPRYFLAICQVP